MHADEAAVSLVFVITDDKCDFKPTKEAVFTWLITFSVTSPCTKNAQMN